jgi:hypothetical protein
MGQASSLEQVDMSARAGIERVSKWRLYRCERGPGSVRVMRVETRYEKLSALSAEGEMNDYAHSVKTEEALSGPRPRH